MIQRIIVAVQRVVAVAAAATAASTNPSRTMK
jgi:hypothetical protein